MNKQSLSIFVLMTLFSLTGYTGNGVERFVMNPNIARTMSERAQTKLVAFISEKCRPSLLNSKKVDAKLVDLVTNKVDQGIIDYTYTVNVQFQGMDHADSESAQITLTDYAGTNPTVDWVQIEKVEMTHNQTCDLN
ncbi:MAG: hypothetical protein A2622_05965 [Bdellovibrionales bacterium RIFCSPHIGHO2_01_FULL_40_29]|nr:MAG: hypothetical protein A2622_05965 [Bdellovibrionales bacterium RIFCSPHIGHO2_01_FULL_40_29]OFZ34999.1 MAG: hypothetical protein A3D17_06315 [Bdellovibrionales bacterium RIFCSPHIGHO2_02_FULL_40_15]